MPSDDAKLRFMHQVAALAETFAGEIWHDAFKAGGDAMRDSIIRAAQVPITSPQAHNPPQPVVEKVERAPGARAPRGAVGRAIDAILKTKPGCSIPDLEELVWRENREIARKSVGNEVRRMEGTKYKRDRPGGYRWFLIDHPVDQEGGEPTPQASASDLLR